MGWNDWKYQEKAPEEIKALAESIFKGEIYISDLLPNKAHIPEVFMPVKLWLMGGAIDALTREHIEMVYAHRSTETTKVFEYGGKTYPIFAQAHCLNAEDAAAVRAMLVLICERYEKDLTARRRKANQEVDDEEPDRQ